MFSDPIKNLKIFGVEESDIIGDLGAGTGHYSIPVAHMCPKGKVYAIEIQGDYVETIKNKIKHDKIKNVECLVGDLERVGGTKLRDDLLDKAITSNVLFQVEDQNKLIEETKRILKKNGKLLLVDWIPGSSVIPIKSAISKEKAKALFEAHGFVLDREVDAGLHHYGMILRNTK
jgi:ubiquinone/menaquinone biosynthesis C-methylase UbiE